MSLCHFGPGTANECITIGIWDTLFYGDPFTAVTSFVGLLTLALIIWGVADSIKRRLSKVDQLEEELNELKGEQE